MMGCTGTQQECSLLARRSVLLVLRVAECCFELRTVNVPDIPFATKQLDRHQRRMGTRVCTLCDRICSLIAGGHTSFVRVGVADAHDVVRGDGLGLSCARPRPWQASSMRKSQALTQSL